MLGLIQRRRHADCYMNHCVAAIALILVVALFASIGVNGFAASRADAATPIPVTTQQLAVPSYIHPSGDPGAWDLLINSTPGKVGIAVANVLNGPDLQPISYWQSVMMRAKAKGIKVLGYVATGYLVVRR